MLQRLRFITTKKKSYKIVLKKALKKKEKLSEKKVPYLRGR